VLSQLRIRNIALIDELEVEFGPGFNLLTGETGSGKSIIVDSLTALTGERVSTDLIKQGAASARIEGIFEIQPDGVLTSLLRESGLDLSGDELIVRRDLSRDGKNRVFVNDQLVTRSFLMKLGPQLADIHGQGEQASLYDVASHVTMLDDFAVAGPQRAAVANAHARWALISEELANLRKDESEKLQLVDILSFQLNEIDRAVLKPGEDAELETEKRRLANAERLAALSSEVYSLLYDDEHATVSTLDRAARAVSELAQFEDSLHEFDDGLAAARAVIEELAATARAYRSKLEFSPERLNEIEERLAEISRLKRKYGESIDAVLAHHKDARQRLENIETAELREQELRNELMDAEKRYIDSAEKLHSVREKAAAKFSKAVERELRDVALEKARFEVRMESLATFALGGMDRVEFYFSANPGESVRPLAKVASGGEASRLMLVLKTVARPHEQGKTAVFDEVDVGIGGRVAEAVGRKLKALSSVSQVFCVTHQPQIASLADQHLVVEKELTGGRTSISVRVLSPDERVEELARMLAGESITDAARENARAMLTAAA
jgi:DNA repair protein RecN (Recombination protein N)